MNMGILYVALAAILLGVVYYFATQNEITPHDFKNDTPMGVISWRCGTVDGTRVCIRP